MNPGNLKTSTGSCSYPQFATVLLLVLAVGLVVLIYSLHKRDDNTAGKTIESFPQGVDIQQRLLRDLADSKNRFFSDEQVAVLKKELSPQRGERMAIECQMGDLESCYLALEINLVFEASGWIVEEFLFAAQSTSGEESILRARDESIMPRAGRLVRLFGSVGLPLTTEIDSKQLFDLKIVVPTKRPKPAGPANRLHQQPS